MLRIVTLNVNGIRSAWRKGFFEWLDTSGAAIACLQETRARSSELPPAIVERPGLKAWFNDGERAGYSGVAIYSRLEPRRVHTRLGLAEFDGEGRYLELEFPRLSVVSLYVPSGTSGEDRQQAKYRFMDGLYECLGRWRRRRREYIICGDWNIAHRPIDLKNWRANQKHSGFLPEERAWLSRVFDELGYVDAFRVLNQEPEQYTWWSNRGRAWEKNVGWRIDYQIITPGLVGRLLDTSIYKAQRFSDHAPLLIDYDLSPDAVVAGREP